VQLTWVLLQVGLDVVIFGCSSGLECVTKKQMSNQMFRNCINDGSRPAVHALQRECTNRLKVLCSKGKVLSV